MAGGGAGRHPRARLTRRRSLSPALSLAIWTAALALLALDRHGPHVAQRAEVFSLIISGISWLSSALAGVAEVTVGYLATALSWLGGHVASLMTNTGSMFSKVWEGAKIVYSDVVKPVAQWLHDTYETIKGWMTRVLGPVFQWANRVRDELQAAYRRYVAPILKILDTSRAVLDILAKLHVPFAAALEHIVTDIEQTISENYLRLLGYVNHAISTLNGFFTLDGLLQKFVLLRSIERDAFYIWRVMANSRSRALTADEQEAIYRATVTQTVPELNDSIVAYWNGESNDVGDVIDALAAVSQSVWQGGDGALAA